MPKIPYSYIAMIGITIVSLMGVYIAYLKIDNAQKETKISTLSADNKTLTEKNTELGNQLLDERIERSRIDAIDLVYGKSESNINWKFIEVTKDVVEYRESPAANRCTIDAKWVRIADASLSIGGVSETGDLSSLQTETGGAGETKSLSQEEFDKLYVTLSDALDVLVRNNKKWALLRDRYSGLYEQCTGEKLQ